MAKRVISCSVMSSQPQVQEVLSRSAEETFQWGIELARSLSQPKNILLYGNLGAGKTVLAKGIVCGLGVSDPDDIVSPSFTLIQEYRVNGRIIQHVDLYRLDSARDIEGLGIEELLNDNSMFVIVEWAEKLPFPQIPNRISIHLIDRGEDERSLQVEYS